MYSIILTSAAPFTPKISLTSLDFQSYIDSLTNNILVAMLVFFIFILCIYMLIIGIQYIVFLLNYSRESRVGKQEFISEQPVDNLSF